MQTRKRWDPPRNRAAYAINPRPRGYTYYGPGRIRRLAWDEINAAEYWLWCALRPRPIHIEPADRAACKAADKARARWYIESAAANRKLAKACGPWPILP